MNAPTVSGPAALTAVVCVAFLFWRLRNKQPRRSVHEDDDASGPVLEPNDVKARAEAVADAPCCVRVSADHEVQQDNGKADGRCDDGNSEDRLPTVYVCMGFACQQDGAQTALVELEELGNLVGGCRIERDWCMGRCGSGPNAVADPGDGREEIFTRLCTLADTSAAVLHATGHKPTISDPALLERLEAVRHLSALERDLAHATTILELQLHYATDDEPPRASALRRALRCVEGVIKGAGEEHPHQHELAQQLRNRIMSTFCANDGGRGVDGGCFSGDDSDDSDDSDRGDRGDRGCIGGSGGGGGGTASWSAPSENYADERSHCSLSLYARSGTGSTHMLHTSSTT